MTRGVLAPAGSYPPAPVSLQFNELSERVDECEARVGFSVENASSSIQSSIDFAHYGSGKATSLEELSQEVQQSRGVLMLKEDSSGKCTPVRVVDSVFLKVCSQNRAGSKILVETGEGRGEQYTAFKLPGEKKERGESTRDTALRIQKENLRLDNVDTQFDLDAAFITVEETTSSSYPGMRTVYREETVQCNVRNTDGPTLARLGVDKEMSFIIEHSKRKGWERSFMWLTEEQATDKQVKLKSKTSQSSIPRLIPVGGMKAQASLCESIVELNRSVESIFQRDRKLQDLERAVGKLEAWQHTEHASVASLIMHGRAKRQYIVRHAGHLREFASSLREIDRLVPSINVPELQHVPAHCDQLRRLEARNAVATGAAARLHEQVARIAEDYHKTMVGINTQLVQWDSQLDSKLAKMKT